MARRNTKKGILIVVSGPSGVGKSTVREEYSKDKSLKLVYSTSMTTRKIREGETDGVDYFFVNQERFDEAVANGELLEYATFVNNSYGTPKKAVEELLDKGKNVILEIEVNGAQQVMEKCPDCLSIFILPPSLEELEKRIRDRGTDSEEVIQGRLAKAKGEMEKAVNYKYTVVNNTIKQAADDIRKIIKAEMKKANAS